MVPVGYHDFFSGCASIAGALIGLLFVAISVSPEKLAGESASADHQVRAGAAFSSLINTLVIALFALLPQTNLGTVGMILGYTGLASTAGLLILLLREHKAPIRPGQIIMFVVLVALYGLQLANGIVLASAARDVDLVGNQGMLAVGFFLFAIARAWQLVGARDTGLLSTVASMADRSARAHVAKDRAAGRPGRDAGHDEHG
jgi:hypothetical protein